MEYNLYRTFQQQHLTGRIFGYATKSDDEKFQEKGGVSN